MKKWTWLDTATRWIRFGPDKRAVREELEAHLEDRAADLLRLFPELTPEEAERQAVEGMGDPWDVGQALGRLHKPWLGWLWRASQAALAAVLILNGITWGGKLLDGAWDSWTWQQERNQEARANREILFGDAAPTWEGERVALGDPEPDLEGRQGNGTFTVYQAALWREPGADGAEDYTLYLDIRLTYDHIWQAGEGAWFLLQAEDSRGNRYEEDVRGYTTRGEQTGPGWQELNLALNHFDPAAEWVRLTYLAGTELNLTVELGEGAAE